MGFCRRCGDIVSGARCKCGGTAVAPTVNWNPQNEADSTHDSWSKTYVQRARSTSPIRPLTTHLTGTTNSTAQTPSTKRFPRPLSQSTSFSSSTNLDNRVSAHIVSSTNRPPSPLKYGTHAPVPEAGILPSLNDTTLSKVYGSVLQPKESLATHSCDICSSPFPPDATIYPDPNSPDSSRFLCRPCYETNGGTKGICPTCSRPVLTLKSEGQFIHAANQFWHKRCFTCSGCLKYIGDNPMVDLFGRPSCADCFESCFNRDPATPKKHSSLSVKNSPRRQTPNNIGGISSASRTEDIRLRDGSPALEELQQRLGIAEKREGSPALEDLSQRLAGLAKSSLASPDGSPSMRRFARQDSRLDQSTGTLGSPADRDVHGKPLQQGGHAELDLTALSTPEKNRSLPDRSAGSPAPTIELIEQMKQRFMKSPSPSPKAATPPVRNGTLLRHSRSSNSLYSSSRTNIPKYDDQPTSPLKLSPMPPFTPDLISDFSDTTTQSSMGLDSPPRSDEFEDASNTFMTKPAYPPKESPRDLFNASEDIVAEETVIMGSPGRTPNSIRNRATPPSRIPRPTPPRRSKSSLVDAPSQPPVDSSGTCAECGCALYSIRGGGKFVTVPTDGQDAASMTYHVECFRCVVCDRPFREGQAGQATFVKANGGACHVECAPSAKIKMHKISSVVYPSIESPSVRPVVKNPTHSKPTSSSRLERPLTSAPLSTPTMFPRFGSRTTCPGCSQWVSPMEQGVVPGPQNTRWHSSCLVCGGKKSTPRGLIIRGEEKRTGPGCGKRLDSAARTGIDGALWCRECLLLVGPGSSQQTSPTRAPLSPTFTGALKLASQTTGTTTIARQFTGIGGGGEAALLRQLTGGGLSPTRSISPTKQVGNGMRPRPKSVIGMRSIKSVDEGRGMFLVRQMTGTG